MIELECSSSRTSTAMLSTSISHTMATYTTHRSSPLSAFRKHAQRLFTALTLLTALFPLLACLAGAGNAGAAERPPNILLIMADDLGFSDLGCYGGEISTPNLDSLAENGLRFTQFYNTARCWPTRGALLTGYYAQQIRRDTIPGLPSGGRGTRPDWAPLLPKLLKPAGYRSYHTGKWHIDGMPIANGFNRSYYLRDQGRFFNPNRHWKDDKPLPPVPKGTDFYATTALADHAIEVLQEHAAKYSEQPFFHYLAFAAPHFPLHALPEDIELYADRYQRGWEVVRQQRWARMRDMGLLDEAAVSRPSRVEASLGPPYHFPDAFKILGPGEVNRPLRWNALTEEQQRFQARKMAIHAAMVHRMDIEIGRVFEQIKQMGQWENTIVIFLSDNGASAEIMVRDDGHDPQLPAGSAGTYLCLGPGWSTTCNTPFRRHKTWTHEGGISTPLLVAWPKGIQARGAIRRQMGHVVDVVPTLLELAGVHRENSEAPRPPGRSFTPLLNTDEMPQRDPVWWFHDGHKAIRSGAWKAVAPIGEPWELYDLSTDRQESTDLALPRADKLQELVSIWETRLAEFTELASADLSREVQQRAKQAANRPARMNQAQQAARPKRTQVLLNGETFQLNGRHAFVMKAENDATSNGDGGKPWIFYGPTLAPYPDKAESWMHRQFVEAGVAVAGIDVGEAYGSPHAFPHFEALYQEMLRRGYSKKPALFGRSRGGLWVSSWAIRHPDRVAGIGGIYPAYDYTTYPGVARAAPVYGVSAEELQQQQERWNPIRRVNVLADADIPVCIIHGTEDKVVPLAPNSGTLQSVYKKADKANLVELIEAEGQGHSFWEGYFHCQELVDFLIDAAKGD